MRRYATLLLLILLAGCAHQSRPDLAALYIEQANGHGQPPVVLIHGMFGARLVDRDTGAEIWPGNIANPGRTYDELALEIDPDTLYPAPERIGAAGVADRAAEIALDESIVPVLRDHGGFVEGKLGEPVKDNRRRFYVFHYDWRKDNVRTVRKFAAFLEQVRRDHGNPDLKVDVAAHGMGGLIVRYYMRYGTLDTLDDNDFPVNYEGEQYIRRVILLGVPNLGATRATQIMLEGLPVGTGRIPPEVFATMPSLYQVFPHPISGWLVDVDGKRLKRDLFESVLWEEFRWSVFHPAVRARIAARFDNPDEAEAHLDVLQRYFDKHIERARRFVWSLTVPAENLERKLIVMGGNCAWTPSKLLVEQVAERWFVRLHPDDVRMRQPGVDYLALMMEPGDGIVTKASQLARQTVDPTIQRHKWSYFPIDYAMFLCESHDRITGNLDFQNNLLHALLTVDERH